MRASISVTTHDLPCVGLPSLCFFFFVCLSPNNTERRLKGGKYAISAALVGNNTATRHFVLSPRETGSYPRVGLVTLSITKGSEWEKKVI